MLLSKPICFKLYSFLQAFNKIRMAQYVHQLADQLHADAMQQLEAAMLGTPAADPSCSKSFHLDAPSPTTSSGTHSWCD